ncbi:MAG: hypothetical protein QM817_10455 [Archangium sp.]
MSATKPFRVAVLACSASKLTHAALAKDLYTGPLFKLARAYAELVADRFVILSARYGVLQPDAELAPYEQRMNDARKWGRRFSNRLAMELFDAPSSEVLFLGGASYFDPLVHSEKERWRRPLKGLAIGVQKATLKQLIDEATPRSLSQLVLEAEAQLHTTIAGEPVGEVLLDAHDWDRIVRAAREAA